MLLPEDDKEQFSLFVARFVLNFISSSDEKGLLPLFVKVAKDPESEGYAFVRDSIKQGLIQNLNNDELLAVFNEIEVDRQRNG